VDGARLALINGSMAGRWQRRRWLTAKHYIKWLTRRNSSIKSLQRDAIAGHSYGPMLNLGGVSTGWLRSIIALQQWIEVRLAGKNY